MDCDHRSAIIPDDTFSASTRQVYPHFPEMLSLFSLAPTVRNHLLSVYLLDKCLAFGHHPSPHWIGSARVYKWSKLWPHHCKASKLWHDIHTSHYTLREYLKCNGRETIKECSIGPQRAFLLKSIITCHFAKNYLP